MSEYSKLINTGSSGCIFYPRLPCEKEKQKGKDNKKKNKKEKQQITKVIVREDKHDKEYEINNLISKIPNHREWTILWTDKCKSHSYKEMAHFSEINKCLSPFEKTKRIPEQQKFTMLQGDYGGIDISSHTKKFSAEVFRNEQLFSEHFLMIFRELGPIFLGIVELAKKQICHHDITSRNIVHDGKKFLLIDYGLSRKYNNKDFFIKRMINEFNNDRIYEAYPFEYIYYPLDDKELYVEQGEIALKYFRREYEKIYKPIHELIFNRNCDELRFEHLEDMLHGKKPKLSDIISKIDVYSLGMLPLIIIIDMANELLIDSKIINQLFNSPRLSKHMKLLYDMTEYHCKKRISASESYTRYKNLIKE